MRTAKEVLDSLPKPKQRKKGKTSRKHGRNYRWGDGSDSKSVTHSLTKYRLRHGIGPGSRKNRKLQAA